MVKSDGAASFCQKSIYQELLCKSRVILALVWAFSNVHSAVLTSHRVPSGNIGQYKVICAHSWLNNRPDSLKGNKGDALYCQLANVELPSYEESSRSSPVAQLRVEKSGRSSKSGCILVPFLAIKGAVEVNVLVG